MADKTIYQLVPEAARRIGPIGKSQRNKAQGFNFRGIDDLYNVAGPIMAELGIFSTPEVQETVEEVVQSNKGTRGLHVRMSVKYTFYAPDGSSVSTVTRGEAMDYGDKASTKAMAIAHKYALFQIFAIPVASQEDPDAHSPEAYARQPQPAQSQQSHSEQPSQRGQLMKELINVLDDAVAKNLITAQQKGETLAKAEKKQTERGLQVYIENARKHLLKVQGEKLAADPTPEEQAAHQAKQAQQDDQSDVIGASA